MTKLSLSLLGTFRVRLDDEPVTDFATDKVRGLLAYLAVEAGRPHRRDALAMLFWPEQPADMARQNLRKTLSRLRTAIGDRDADPPFLLITRQTLQFNTDSDHWVDVVAFTDLIEACEGHRHRRRGSCLPCLQRLQRAVELYRGDFLEGFAVSDSVAFEEWTLLLREKLHRQTLDALRALAVYAERRGEFKPARQYAQRQIELEPWREEAHRQLMKLLASVGQRSAALAQYETCRSVLAEELGVEPAEETTSLYEQIKAGELRSSGAGETSPVHPGTHAPWHTLPAQLTSFIGREEELAQLNERLAAPNCRLLTLVGPGGSGKTRLALQAAADHLGLFAHGVHFVPLASVHSPEHLIPALADALDLSFQGTGDPEEQLLDYLRGKEMLLVVDNLEHLLAGVGVLAEILAAVPEVHILATSRERLNLQAECVFDLRGLLFPQGAGAARRRIADYGAVQLFAQRAVRVQRDFALSSDTIPGVVRICRLVEGMPLAIELAAAWVRSFSLEQIADEVQRNLDFLTTSMRDVPARHRSVRAVFEHSWSLLAEEEQRAFRALSVFRGGFDQAAAQWVADAPPALLARLVDKSLLQRSHAERFDKLTTERYEMHELLRQYAEERLGEVPDQELRTHDRHCAYYAQFLQQLEEQITGTQQKHALQKIAREFGNVRAAWLWASERAQETELGMSLYSLHHFYRVKGRLQEAVTDYERATEALADRKSGVPRSLTYWNLRAFQGAFLTSLGCYERAGELLETSLAALRRLGARPETAFCLRILGRLAIRRGEWTAAMEYLKQSLSIYRALGDQRAVATTLNALGVAANDIGDYVQAREYLEESVSLYREYGDLAGLVYALNNLGASAYGLAAYQEARARYREALATAEAIDFRRGIALCLLNLADVAGALDDHATARELAQESLKLSEETNDERNAVWGLCILGKANCALGNYDAAGRVFRQALAQSIRIRAIPRTLESLAGTARLLASTGKPERAAELATLCLHHPASQKKVSDRAEDLLAQLEGELPADVIDAAEAAESRDLVDVVRDLVGNKSGAANRTAGGR